MKRSETRMKIVRTLATMLKEQPLKDISVSDIIELANISRGTFYYHFNSKEDLVISIINTALNKITDILSQDLDFGQPILTEVLEYIYENKAIAGVLLDHLPNVNQITEKYISDTIKKSNIVDLEKQLVEGYQIPVHYAFNLYILTIKSIIFEWIRSDFQEAPAELADIIHRAVRI
ncbi:MULTISPECIES: TetR/AcrR family transcriptional regulator [unclassified Streptococcus]|uniref:TetR/AcrR family transcriptional regulator n=1 Tax=unclassified Streptococcus TaxID=2608887 RepID=UPI00103A98C9|nr:MULTISPECIES: TetR/AcrR family transcriptional regulator [unclassified Streptococcus]